MRNIRTLLTIVILYGFTTNVFSQSREKQRLWDKAIEYMEAQRYNDAIEIFESLNSDPAFTEDCKIKIVEAKRKIAYVKFGTKDGGLFEGKPLNIGYGGVDTTLIIDTNYDWQINAASNGVVAEKKGKNGLRILIQEENKGLENRTEYVKISAGKYPNVVQRELKIVQKAHPAYLQCSSKTLNFPAVENLSTSITVHTNHADTQWNVSCDSSWCRVACDSSNIRISVEENYSVENRKTLIVVSSILDSRLNLVVEINQTAGEAELVVSKDNLFIPAEEHSEYVLISSNARWSISDFPTWATAERVSNSDSIRITCYENITGAEREANVNIKAGNKVVPIHLKQETKPFVPQYPFEIFGGRNLSFGVNVGGALPMVFASTSSKFMGSVVNYGRGDNVENASYIPQLGFSLGMIVDIRLYKNLYFKTGIDYELVQYSNSFKGEADVVTSGDDITYYLRGTTMNTYNEDYTFQSISIPLLVSYRFVINENSALHLDFGPYIDLGLSAKMHLTGNTDSETLYQYAIVDGMYTLQKLSSYRYDSHFYVDDVVDLYSQGAGISKNYTYGNGKEHSFYEKEDFESSPFKRYNIGLNLGVSYEYAGFNIGLGYKIGLTNMSNANYWDSERLPIWYPIPETNMSGYKQRFGILTFSTSYIFRY